MLPNTLLVHHQGRRHSCSSCTAHSGPALQNWTGRLGFLAGSFANLTDGKWPCAAAAHCCMRGLACSTLCSAKMHRECTAPQPKHHSLVGLYDLYVDFASRRRHQQLYNLTERATKKRAPPSRSRQEIGNNPTGHAVPPQMKKSRYLHDIVALQ